MSEYEEMARAIVIKMQFQEKPLHFDQALKCAKEAVKVALLTIESIEMNVDLFVNPTFKFYWDNVLDELNEMENEK